MQTGINNSELINKSYYQVFEVPYIVDLGNTSKAGKKNTEILHNIQTKKLFFPWIKLTVVTFDTFVSKPTPQDLLLDLMKQFITSSVFCHLFMKRFVVRFSS